MWERFGETCSLSLQNRTISRAGKRGNKFWKRRQESGLCPLARSQPQFRFSCSSTFNIYRTPVAKVKVKVILVQALRLCTGRTAHRGSRDIALPFHYHGTRRRWGVSFTPRPLFTPGKDRYPLYRRLGGPKAGLEKCGKSRPPPGFDPRTVKPVASRCTDWATRPTKVK